MARAYKVTTPIGQVQYASSMADARTKRDEMVEANELKKKDVKIEETEVPTSKTDLLPWLNTELRAAFGDGITEGLRTRK